MRSQFVALLGLVAIASITTPATAQTVWEMPTEYPASAIPGEGVAMFARLVTERSAGRLTIQPSFDASKGIKSVDMIAAVQQGKVQAGDTFAGAVGSLNALFALSSLPFLATSVEDARTLTELARPAYQKLLASYGQRLLYTTPWPASGIWSKTALASAAGLEGLAIRTYDPTSTEVMNAAGAKATLLSFADAMPKVKDGSVTAVLSSGDGGAGRGLWVFLPHFTEVNYAMPLSIASVNAAAYEALPPDLQRIVDETAAETERRQWTAIRTRLEENYSRMRANGVTIRTDVPADLAASLATAAKTVINDWRQRAGPGGAQILDQYLKR